jgi:hypothetical protein
MALLPSVLAKPVASLYSFSSHTFTNAGATGRNGPTLTACRSAYLSASPWTANDAFFSMPVSGVQRWTVPRTTTYTFTVAGAASGATAGLGRIIRFSFSLTEGQQVRIVVGQRGLDSGYPAQGSGGGGGTYVVFDTTNVIIGIAGGGGGFGDAVASDPGAASAKGNLGGSGGSGGTVGQDGGAGGGAGYSGDGQAANGGTAQARSFLGFSVGGDGYPSGLGDSAGGFGGGGGGFLNNTSGPFFRSGGGGGYSGGGGGGYNGGGAANAGGGGSCFVSASASGANLSFGLNSGHGYVTVSA